MNKTIIPIIVVGIAAIMLLLLLVIKNHIEPTPKPMPISFTGNVYYVTKEGSDNNPGTKAEPWRTINHAVRLASR